MPHQSSFYHSDTRMYDHSHDGRDWLIPLSIGRNMFFYLEVGQTEKVVKYLKREHFLLVIEPKLLKEGQISFNYFSDPNTLVFY